MFSTNVNGLINMTQAILPLFKSRPSGGRGDIINIGSIAGREPYPGGSIYCATKAAVRAFTDALRRELIATRIRVIEVDPGQVETEFSVVRFYGDKSKADKVYEGCEPLTPDDIAEIVVFAAGRRENVVVADTLVFPNHQVSERDFVFVWGRLRANAGEGGGDGYAQEGAVECLLIGIRLVRAARCIRSLGNRWRGVEIELGTISRATIQISRLYRVQFRIRPLLEKLRWESHIIHGFMPIYTHPERLLSQNEDPSRIKEVPSHTHLFLPRQRIPPPLLPQLRLLLLPQLLIDLRPLTGLIAMCSRLKNTLTTTLTTPHQPSETWLTYRQRSILHMLLMLLIPKTPLI